MQALRAAALTVTLVVAPAVAETAYVTNEQDNTVSVINGDPLGVVATIPVGRRPRGAVRGAPA